MKLLSISNLSMSFDAPLFSGVTFDIDSSDRIGLVGPNGAGKSTLFKIILGELSATSGDVFLSKQTKLGYMAQHLDVDNNRTLYDETLHVFSHLHDIHDELTQLNHDIDHQKGDLDALVKRQYLLTERYNNEGGLTYQSRTRSMLLGLGFSELDMNKKINMLSGGERTKVSLAKMLLSDADLLLLDEPTNHLDIQSVEWLEAFLMQANKALMVISHDRRFLDNITNRTFDLNHERLKAYDGNYSQHLKQQVLDEEQISRDNKNIQREIDRINRIIEQQKRWNRERNIKTAKNKQHEVDRLKVKLKDVERKDKSIFIQFDIADLGGRDVISVKDLTHGFGDVTLFKDLNFSVTRGERIFLLGANGCGKSTLFKILTGEFYPNNGIVTPGTNVSPSYFDQTQSNLIESKTAYDMVHDEYPSMTETQVRSLLGAFMFIGDDAFKVVGDLSGGERARLSLLILMLSKANFLLLDEPTNHLDIMSKEALQHALSDYPGTLFIISHDRYLINEMADRILYMENQSISEYLGNYDDYLLKRANQPASESTQKKSSSESDYAKKKKRQSELNRLNGKISRLEDEILKQEQLISDYEAQMAQPKIASDFVKASELANQTDQLNTHVLSLYEELHTLETQRDEI